MGLSGGVKYSTGSGSLHADFELERPRFQRHAAMAREAANAAAGRRRIGRMFVHRNICDRMHVENHTVTSTQTDASELK